MGSYEQSASVINDYDDDDDDDHDDVGVDENENEASYNAVDNRIYIPDCDTSTREVCTLCVLPQETNGSVGNSSCDILLLGMGKLSNMTESNGRISLNEFAKDLPTSKIAPHITWVLIQGTSPGENPEFQNILNVLGQSLPALTNITLYRGYYTATGLASFFRSAPQITSFARGHTSGQTGLTGSLADFEELAEAIKGCKSLRSFRFCLEPSVVGHEENSEDDDSEDESISNRESGRPLDEVRRRQQVALQSRLYDTKRPQDFSITVWNPVVQSLAVHNRECLSSFELFMSRKWQDSNRLTHETSCALVDMPHLKWPLNEFPFTLSIDSNSIDDVVDYLMKVHNENGVVTHFIPDNPMAQGDHFLKTFVSTYEFHLPTFRMMFNGKSDPGRKNDIFVVLNANLVDPDMIKARLIERVKAPNQPVRVAVEVLHEPKHMLFYQGIVKHNLWDFDPETSSDAQFLDMLSVLAKLGPHGSFFHKSVDYGLAMRYNLLSPQRDRLLQWIER